MPDCSSCDPCFPCGGRGFCFIPNGLPGAIL
nr:MAG TPA: Potassium channel toxin [Bacteriophage sp.]DAP98377.1 MAG TPA: Potassium channel toxin [Bacteriophage sp.]